MGWHEVESAPRFRVKCLTKGCDFSIVKQTPGGAEDAAKAHLEEDNEDHGLINYNHEVEIVEVRMVGRDL